MDESASVPAVATPARGWRVHAFAAVVACFFAQAGLVWADVGEHPGSTATISPLAREGQTIFRAKNCQSCHAMFGMGGYLGPDLTNAARRVPAGRFAEVLDKGTTTMPAFHLNEGEQRAVQAYLEAIDATGQGTPPAPAGERGPLFSASLARYAARDLAIPAAVAEGAAVVSARSCGTCHNSFAAEGIARAPDLSLAVGHLGPDGVRRVLADGRGAMAAAHLDAHDTEAVLTLLTWVGEHRAELAPAAPVALRDVPWFAYPARREAPPATPVDTGFLVADRAERQ